MFEGVSFKDLSTHIRTMLDIDDCIVGTRPPGTHLPPLIDGLGMMVPVRGHFLGSPGTLVYGASKMKERFVELVADFEKGDWGLDLEKNFEAQRICLMPSNPT